MTTIRPIYFLPSLLLLVTTFSIHCPAVAQDLQLRMSHWRMRQAVAMSRQTALTQQKTLTGPRWVAAAQIVPAMQQSIPQSPPSVPPPPEPTPEGQTEGRPAKPPRPKREIRFYASTAVGFDKQSAINTDLGPLQVERRRIHSVVVSAEYPLTDKTDIALVVPYIRQSARTTTSFGTFTQRGQGIGDVALYLERRFPDIARGTELSVAVGMQFPTGKDPFETGINELPTGIGFYQPVARVSIRKMRVPLHFYASLDYGTSFSRRIDGEKVTLPDSYGGEVGFYYALGPEFTAQTGLSLSKVSSPFILGPGSTVSYLSQSLTYNSGGRTSWRASVDVGLTEDSTDAYFGLAMMSSF